MHPTFSRPLWRMALALWELYQQRSRQPWNPYLPELAWDRCQELRRQITRADRRGYHGAGRRLRIRLAQELADLARKCEQEHTLSQRPTAEPPTLRLLYEELVALQAEFDVVDVDPDSLKLSVHTDPFVLEGVHLGRFEIAINGKRMMDAGSYSVNALDPNPATSNQETTHPHVHAGKLCEGDGWKVIRETLTQGRLSEFFLIVKQILSTYNADSAHVLLSEWEGSLCAECGYTSSDEDSYSCNGCLSSLCPECCSGCECCSDNYCRDCLERCPCCEEPACRGCLRECDQCGESVCRHCLDEPETICTTCLENSDGETESETTEVTEDIIETSSEDETEPSATAATAVHADGLGQAAVPA